MKKLLFISLLIWLCFSCEKYTIPYMPENPEWLESRISTIKSGTNYGYKIDLYFWKNEYFYHIGNMISSCRFCDFCNYEGQKYLWQESEMKDFFTYGKFIGTVWSTPPFSD